VKMDERRRQERFGEKISNLVTPSHFRKEKYSKDIILSRDGKCFKKLRYEFNQKHKINSSFVFKL